MKLKLMKEEDGYYGGYEPEDEQILIKFLGTKETKTLKELPKLFDVEVYR